MSVKQRRVLGVEKVGQLVAVEIWTPVVILLDELEEVMRLDVELVVSTVE